MDAAIQQLFSTAQKIVFMTGAGVSTPSGIPDYRSKNGLYTGHRNAEYYLSHAYLADDPAGFYQYVKENLYYPKAQPNVIHQKMAALTQQGRASVVTQNIDNLYELAGTQNLIEFHGNLYRIYCQRCGKTVSWQTYLANRIHQECGGELRPAIVLYDEAIDQTVAQRAIQTIQAADLIVIVGTSMRVYPFAGLVDYRQPTAPVLVVNREALTLPFRHQQIQTEAVTFFDDLVVD